jgi:hypothetical protein
MIINLDKKILLNIFEHYYYTKTDIKEKQKIIDLIIFLEKEIEKNDKSN